jgi:hypothetical protein
MKTVALVGMAQSTRDLAPWDNEDIEIWTLNESPAKRFGYVKRVTRHFQLHPYWSCMREENQNDPEHPQWLRSRTEFPIYMQEVFEDIPMSVKYPLEEVFGLFDIPVDGGSHWKEFTNTLPYMLGLAVLEGFERIEIYGFEMGSETEYAYQRPCVHLWLGILRGMQLATGKPEIYIPDGIELLGWGMPLYGFEQILGLNPMEIEIDRNKFGNQRGRTEAKLNDIQGRQQELNTIIQAIRTKYDERAEKIRNKKGDRAMIERRLAALSKEADAEMKPFRARVQALEGQKLDSFGMLNYFKGGEDQSQSLLDRYNKQRPKNGKPLGMSGG